MKRYLLILEDNSLIQVDEVTQNDLSISDKGYIQIVDIQEGKEYIGNNEWKIILGK